MEKNKIIKFMRQYGYYDFLDSSIYDFDTMIEERLSTVTDEMAMELYIKSTIPEKSYYKAIAGLAIRGHINTALKIIEDKVNKENVNKVIREYEDFYCPTKEDDIIGYNNYHKILDVIKNLS